MEIIIYIICGFVVGFVATIVYITYIVRRTLENLAKKAGMTYEEYNQYLDKISGKTSAIVTDIITLFTEQQGRTVFAYDFKTKEFVTQGSSLEDLARNCFSFKKIDRAVVYHEGKIVYFIQGTIVAPANENKI